MKSTLRKGDTAANGAVREKACHATSLSYLNSSYIQCVSFNSETVLSQNRCYLGHHHSCFSNKNVNIAFSLI